MNSSALHNLTNVWPVGSPILCWMYVQVDLGQTVNSINIGDEAKIIETDILPSLLLAGKSGEWGHCSFLDSFLYGFCVGCRYCDD